MKIKDRMREFNKRWNINIVNDPQEEFSKFKIRLINIFQDIDSYLDNDSIREFCQYFGINEIWIDQGIGSRYSKNVINKLSKETTEIGFYRLIEILFMFDMREGHIYSQRRAIDKKMDFYEKVEATFEISNISANITLVDGYVTIYPRGEEILDNELVNEPLSFLEGNVSKNFVEALKFYQSKKYVKSAESLRRVLEDYLRVKLKNDKGLTANIILLQKTLKSQKENAQIRTIISSTFNHLDQYFNDNSKHSDGDIDEVENEFLIYQCGLLLRIINKII